MANLIRSRGWGQVKPTAGSQIDWGHPLAQNLAFVALLNESGGRPVDLVSGRASASIGTQAWTAGGRNYTSSFDEWAAPSSGAGLWGQITSSFTMAVAGTSRSAFNSFSGWMVCHNTPTTANSAFGIQGDGGGDPALYTNDTSRCAVARLAAGIPCLVIAGQTPAAAFIERYDNGKAGPAATASGTAATITNPRSFMVVGTERTHAQSFPGHLNFGYVWSAALTRDQRMWLAAEPYAFIQPPAPKVFYLALGSGVTPVTGSAAITGTGTVSATGVRTRLGASAITGTGTVAASGTRSRSGAASVSGSGTVSASGTVTRSGSASIAGTGAVTISGVRTVLAAAALAGDGTITAAGATTVAGTAAISGTGIISATSALALPACVVLTVSEPYACVLTVSEPYTVELSIEEC